LFTCVSDDGVCSPPAIICALGFQTGNGSKANSLSLLGQDQQQQQQHQQSRSGMNQRLSGGSSSGGGGANSGGGSLVVVKQEAVTAGGGSGSSSVENLVAGFVDSTTFLSVSPVPSSTVGSAQHRQQHPPGLPPSLPPPRQTVEEPTEGEPVTTVHPSKRRDQDGFFFNFPQDVCSTILSYLL